MTAPLRPQSAEQIIVCEPDFSSKWEPTRDYRLNIKGITIFRGLEANCRWMKEQIETAFAQAYARAAAPQRWTDQDLYDAYLHGCEDDCLPEPLDKETFLASWEDTRDVQ